MAIVEIKVPDLEGSTDVGVVEVYVHIGDTVENETPLISLESDKAVMDVPSPLSGIIKEIKVSEGDNVNAGDVIALAEVIEKVTEEIKDVIEEAKPQEEPAHQAPENETASEGKYHATPSVRSLARAGSGSR